MIRATTIRSHSFRPTKLRRLPANNGDEEPQQQEETLQDRSDEGSLIDKQLDRLNEWLDEGSLLDKQLDRLDEWLDRPVFDPDADLDENSLQYKFAQLVKNDYELAETLYAGAFFAVMIVVSQEMLRFQIHGQNYVPFSSSSSIFH